MAESGLIELRATSGVQIVIGSRSVRVASAGNGSTGSAAIGSAFASAAREPNGPIISPGALEWCKCWTVRISPDYSRLFVTRDNVINRQHILLCEEGR